MVVHKERASNKLNLLYLCVTIRKMLLAIRTPQMNVKYDFAMKWLNDNVYFFCIALNCIKNL